MYMQVFTMSDQTAGHTANSTSCDWRSDKIWRAGYKPIQAFPPDLSFGLFPHVLYLIT